MRYIKNVTGMFMIIALIVMINAAAGAQNWTEDLDFNYSYDLKGTKILIIASDDFNSGETIEMGNLWKSFGANVKYAGPSETLIGEEPEFQIPGEEKSPKPELKVDYLLKNINPEDYDVIYFAGGEGIGKLIEGNKITVAKLIDKFYKENKMIAAMCHAPMVLSVSESIRGKKATANGDKEREFLRNSGAIISDEICIVDYPFITGQWPFLQTFAYTIAERIQFPEGNGPLQKYFQNLSQDEKKLSGLRGAAQLSAKPVEMNKVKKIIRAAMLTPPQDMSLTAYFPFKLVLINSPETRSLISTAIFEKTKDLFTARGVPAEVIQKRLNNKFVTSPNLVLAVMDTSRIPARDKTIREITLRNNMLQYGAARENMIIMSEAMDLGISFAGFPVFMMAQDDIKKIVEIPENYILIDMFAIGHPESLSLPPVSASIDNILIEEKWNSN